MKVVNTYYTEIIEKFGNTGQMDPDTFKKLFQLAFPERPEDKLELLVNKLRNVEKTSGDIRKKLYQSQPEGTHTLHCSHLLYSHADLFVLRWKN